MDYKKAVDDKKKESADLHTRMDADSNLVNLTEYVLRDVNEKKVPRAISVTLNDPAVFAANVESSLGSAVEQIAVESEDEKVDTHYIEDVVRACLVSANQRLIKQGRFSLNPYIDQQMCRRGRGAARCLFRMEEGQFIADIVPWDTRFLYYAMDVDGLAWAAYEPPKKYKDEIESDPWAKEIGFTISGEKATILDIWTPKLNEIYVDGKKVYEQPNPCGYPPVCIQLVPMGSMLADANSKYQGESIFFLIRDLLPELNRLVSIIQSLNMKELDHALLWKSREGTTAEPPKFDDLTSPGRTIATDIGGGAEPVSFGALKQQAWLLHSMIETRIQRGSLSNFEYGTFTQPMSAVALITVGEGRDQVFLPRLGARGLLNQQLAVMLIDQIIKTGERSVKIGTRGHKRSFDVAKLQGEYEITFNYFIKSPKIDMARYSMAASIGNLIPDKAKRREILQREDPEEDERQLRWEEAEMISPAIKLNRIYNSLLEMADKGDEDAEFEAELVSKEMERLVGLAPGETEGKKATIPKKEGLLPMFGGTAAQPKSSAQKAADLRRTPVEEE